MAGFGFSGLPVSVRPQEEMILGNAGSRETAFGAGLGIARMFVPVKTKKPRKRKTDAGVKLKRPFMRSGAFP